jgi:hypothetical protein
LFNRWRHKVLEHLDARLITPFLLLELFWLYSVVELAPVPVRAIEVGVKVFAFFCPVVCCNMLLLEKLVISMGKCAFWPIFTFAHFPVTAHFCLELLLEVACTCCDLARFDGLEVWDIEILGIIIFVILTCIHVIFTNGETWVTSFLVAFLMDSFIVITETTFVIIVLYPMLRNVK